MTQSEDELFLMNQDYSHAYTTPLEHILDIYNEVLIRKPASIMELGTYRGLASIAMARAQKKAGIKPAVETFDTQRHPELLFEPGITSGIFLHISPSLKALCREYCRHWATYNFIFHDSVHAHQAVPEYHIAWHCVKSGGCLCIHDWNQVKEYEFGILETFGFPQYRINKHRDGRELIFITKP